MSIDHYIDELRMFLDCDYGQIVHDCRPPGGRRDVTALDDKIERVLGEIERLQGPTRWRDPDDTDGLPDYEPVLVVNPTGGPAVGYHTTDGWGTFGFSDFDVAAWMPVPKFTEVTP